MDDAAMVIRVILLKVDILNTRLLEHMVQLQEPTGQQMAGC
jgi:hypothetical protein